MYRIMATIKGPAESLWAGGVLPHRYQHSSNIALQNAGVSLRYQDPAS